MPVTPITSIAAQPPDSRTAPCDASIDAPLQDLAQLATDSEPTTTQEYATVLRRAIAMLRALEFVAPPRNWYDPDTLVCPRCGGDSIFAEPYAHKSGCDLDALLREIDP